MKISTFAPLALTVSFAPAAFADDPVPNPPIPVPASEVFVPDGFDDNDESQVVLDGYLPDTCYKLAFVRTDLNRDTGKIRVTQYARRHPGVCLPALVPYTSEAGLGVLPMGAYKVAARGLDLAALKIKEATTAGPDDFFYAPVDSASVAFDEARQAYVATIRGRFTSRCMEWKNVQILDQGKVKVILPILETPDTQEVCEVAVSTFERDIVLPAMTPGRYLLHVRSLNGKAVNNVFSVD